MKKKYIIILIIIGILALGAGIYFAWINNKGKIQNSIEALNTTVNSIIGNNQPKPKIKAITGEAVLDYKILDNSSSSIVYINNNKELKIIDGDGNQSQANGYVLLKPNINDISLYDLNDKTYLELNGSNALLSPDNKKIIIFNSEKQTSFLTQDINLLTTRSQQGNYYSLNIADAKGDWVNPNLMSLMPKPTSEMTSDVWTFDLTTKTLNKLFSERGIMLSWAKFGDIGLKFSTTESRQNSFSLVNAKGETLTNFNFITFPDKCVITSPAQIYCAISKDQNVFTNLTLPDDYLMRKIRFNDGIYQVELDQQKITPLYEQSDPLIDAIKLSVLGNKLFFINRYDGRLYSLDL